MKKIIFMLMAMATMAFAAHAQIEPKTFRYGIQLNLGTSNVNYSDDEIKNKMAFSYGVHWIAEYNIDADFYLRSGLGIENIAYKGDWVSKTLNSFYLELPIHVGCRYVLNETTSMFFQGGPTLGIGLTGTKIEWAGAGTTDYFGDEFAKRFNLGLGARVGVEFGKMQLSLGGNYGLTKVYKPGGHTISVNLGIGYIF